MWQAFVICSLLVASAMAASDTTPYFPMFPPSQHFNIAVVTFATGLVFFGLFVVQLVSTSSTSINAKRSIVKEILLSFVASVFLGIGALFILLAAGVYV